MPTKLSEPMQNVLMKLGKGWGWDDFGVDGPPFPKCYNLMIPTATITWSRMKKQTCTSSVSLVCFKDCMPKAGRPSKSLGSGCYVQAG